MICGVAFCGCSDIFAETNCLLVSCQSNTMQRLNFIQTEAGFNLQGSHLYFIRTNRGPNFASPNFQAKVVIYENKAGVENVWSLTPLQIHLFRYAHLQTRDI